MTTEKQKNWKEGWEYRSAKMIVRIIAVLLFIGYLSFTSWLAWQWVHITYIQSQSFSNITQVAEDAIIDGELSDLTEWISYRASQDDGEETIEALTPYIDKIGPGTFFLFRNAALEKGNVEDAIFWHQYALYRLRYDALRCQEADAPEIIDILFKSSQTEKIQNILPKNEAELKKVLQRVLAFDAKYPAKNYPYDTCKMITTFSKKRDVKIIDVEKWKIVHHQLLMTTERAIEKMDTPQE